MLKAQEHRSAAVPVRSGTQRGESTRWPMRELPVGEPQHILLPFFFFPIDSTHATQDPTDYCKVQ